MCGINGFISTNQNTSKKIFLDNINAMNNLIFHRGPDDDGVYTDINNDTRIAMGMRRLSIIDLSSGKQPIFSDNKQIVIVFNGEIYNYLVLKKELEEKNVTFKTKSDTEVILRMYEMYGIESFKKLDGMFAFSIHDKIKNKVFIARDFFGEKPLYYTKNDNGFYWASELKSIVNQLPLLPRIDNLGLNLYFKLTYIPAPYTIYEGIKKLESNNYIEYDLKSNNFSSIIIENEHPKNIKKPTFSEAKAKVKDLVQQSVESRSVADVPLGTFLSGGVDSSIVSLCLSRINNSKINTFSIGFEKKSFDESDKARTVAKLINSNHHEFIINEKDLENHVHDILDNFDEPFADSSCLPTYLVANKTSQHVKVALTGDGGDEVFGGYNKYYMGNINQKYTRIVPNTIHKAISKPAEHLFKTKDDNRGVRFLIRRLLNSINYSGDHYWDIISLGFPSNSLSSFLLPEFFQTEPFEYYKESTNIKSPKNLTEYRLIDKVMSLEGDMLVKVDRTSMLSSLECRAPFLNKKLWEYTKSLPHAYLMKGWDKKFILKEAFKGDFPKNFLIKSKSGFGVPVGDWLRSSLKKDLEYFVNDAFLDSQNIFKKEAIKQLVFEHLNGKDHTFKVWTFYCFQKWYCKEYKS
ncbi:asparagine synthase (glutamine-hydrolyzing) [Tamlana fucoidanivorans]|uniref:asparagine synthase (glutamine-hydrolyzing) n=1 Tax=Allotamlana fucoidanivorans TaxID=2583814 RepID=A0A5C4SQ82_9FLAO|nr:asparagine synthase (glutamine-hydrolyzing) [Tamlana fucoidanivorans]TNJ46468.1 asparagine synthase (glutamine-hydrolyzing) [Tamlana fucoidanivorans]